MTMPKTPKPIGPATPTLAKSPSPSTARQLAPVFALAATYGVRKALASGYEHTTGKPAPFVSSPKSSLVAKVLWTAAVAAAVALVEAIYYEWLERHDE